MTIIEKLLASNNENRAIRIKINTLHVYALYWMHAHCWKEIEKLQSSGKSTTMLFGSVITIDDLHKTMKLCVTLICKASMHVKYNEALAIERIYSEFEKLHTFESVEDNNDD